MEYFAPKFWNPEAGKMMVELEGLREDFISLEQDHMALTESNTKLQANFKETSQLKNEAETRLTLAENTRAQSAKRVQELEEQILEMERRMAFYEKLVTPETEEDVLQCFNISIKKAKNKLTYGINFLKHDQTDKSRIDSEVRFKVMYGESMLNLTEEPAVKDDRQVSMSFTKTKRLRGSLITNVPEEGLHILDIKAYDKKSDKVIAHCWKAF